MSNENFNTLDEVREMLRSSNLPTKQAARVSLAMMADIYEAIQVANELENTRHKKIDEDLALLKKKSIVIWVEENKAISTFILTLVIIVFLFAQSIAVPWIAKALGIPY